MHIKLALWCAVVFVCLYAQGPNRPVRFRAVGDIQVTHKFEAIPKWSGNALVSVEGSPSASPLVWIFDQEGRQIAQITVSIPDANYIEVRDAAHGVNGLTAICGAANDSAGHRAGFLALVSADGKMKSLIRTEPYSPTAVVIAPDDSIWMKGVEYLPVERKPSKTQNGILRHFDESGKLIGSFLPQSGFSLTELFGGIDHLAANSTRVGWYNGGGATSYFEVVGGQVDRYSVVPPRGDQISGPTMQKDQIFGLTIADDEHVFVSSSVSGRDPKLFTLDRLSRSWVPVTLPEDGTPPLTSWLLGGTGKVLVFRTTAQLGWLRRVEEFTE
jgi:hypothetical protein